MQLPGSEPVRVLPEHALAGRSIYTLYASHRHLQRKVGAFVAFLAGVLQGQPDASATTPPPSPATGA